MRTAKAAVLEGFNAPLRLREFPIPSTVERGAALVRTEMAGICGTDVHLWKGQRPLPLPVILGHETVGTIVEMGEGLGADWTGEPLSVGNRVTWNSASSCGECFYCRTKELPTRCPARRAYGIGYCCNDAPHWLGGYAEYHYLRPGTSIFKIPAGLPTDSVIGAGCALITAIHGMERLCGTAGRGGADAAMPTLPERWNDTVVVQGAGPVGIAVAAVARNAGAKQVVLVGGPGHRLELAARFGVDRTISLEDTPDPAERIELARKWSGGHGADAVIECVGVPGAVAEGMEMCRDGGKYLVLGHYCDAGPGALNPHVITRKELDVLGSWSSEPRHLRAALAFLESSGDRFPFASLITHRHKLDEANEALKATAAWRSVKSVIVPG